MLQVWKERTKSKNYKERVITLDKYATLTQRDYIKELCDKLGYDEEMYLADDLTRKAASQTISDLKNEWEG